jgi:hypothetical protein
MTLEMYRFNSPSTQISCSNAVRRTDAIFEAAMTDTVDTSRRAMTFGLATAFLTPAAAMAQATALGKTGATAIRFRRLIRSLMKPESIFCPVRA